MLYTNPKCLFPRSGAHEMRKLRVYFIACGLVMTLFSESALAMHASPLPGMWLVMLLIFVVVVGVVGLVAGIVGGFGKYSFRVVVLWCLGGLISVGLVVPLVFWGGLSGFVAVALMALGGVPTLYIAALSYKRSNWLRVNR